MRRGLLTMALAAASTAAAAQTNLQSAGIPQAAVDPANPAVAAPVAGPTAAATAPEPVYVRRDVMACGDFKRVEAGGWSVLASVQFPGPQGPVKLAAGQVVGPGDYVSGLNLAAMLQRDCPITPAP